MQCIEPYTCHSSAPAGEGWAAVQVQVAEFDRAASHSRGWPGLMPASTHMQQAHTRLNVAMQ